MNEIISNQFSSWGKQPWFITKVLGELYIKKEWETKSFIEKIYLPCCALIGNKHRIQSILLKVVINDEDNLVETNNFHHNGANGIELTSSDNITIVDNAAFNNIESGISVFSGDNSRLEANDLYLNGENGIR